MKNHLRSFLYYRLTHSFINIFVTYYYIRNIIWYSGLAFIMSHIATDSIHRELMRAYALEYNVRDLGVISKVVNRRDSKLASSFVVY